MTSGSSVRTSQVTPESTRPLAKTLGFYIPAQKRSRKAGIEAMRAAPKEPDAMDVTDRIAAVAVALRGSRSGT